MSTVHETDGVINSLHCNCGATWIFKDGAVEYKAGKAIVTEDSSVTALRYGKVSPMGRRVIPHAPEAG